MQSRAFKTLSPQGHVAIERISNFKFDGRIAAFDSERRNSHFSPEMEELLVQRMSKSSDDIHS